MAAEENATEAHDLGGGGGSPGTSKLVVIASLVNMVVSVGIIVVLILAHRKEASRPTVQDIVSGQVKGQSVEAKGDEKGKAQGDGVGLSDTGKIIALDPFTVNLASGIATFPRYVRMNMSVELETGASDKEFSIKLPRVRDTIINLLNSKRAVEINAPAGRTQLKEEIRQSVNAFMLQSKVKAVYFTSFAISN